MPVAPDEFKAALARFASGVTVVTLSDDDGDHGMTASAFTSVSLDPPLVLVCVTKGNATHQRLQGAGGFAVNILSADQVTVSNRFAGWWDEGKSKWDDLTLTRGSVSGAPLIGGALAQLDCSTWSTADGGDHTIFIGQVEGATVSPSAPDALAPLLYFAGGYRTIGSAP
jgi:flavin reductase (DIM6/NTAB) family NADH-FMN oxidoreductase RutF